LRRQDAQVRQYSDSDKSLDQFVLLKSADELFSMPIPPEERQKYSLTQFLSDTLRQLKFDGVGYRSSVGVGVNYAVFDPAAFRYVAESAKVTLINRLTYDSVDVTTMERDNEYMTNLNGELLQ
jgi:hypothetical protein